MDENNQYHYESRSDMRKKRNNNRILNLSIGVVVVLIGFFMFSLLFDSEEVADEEVETDDVEEIEDDFVDESSDDEEISEVPDSEIDEEDELTDPAEEDALEEDDGEETSDDESAPSPPEDGNYEPIGTEQESLDFNFDEGSQNRNEMMQAMEYATGIPVGDWDYLEWIGNNGFEAAVGTMYYQGTPYTVEMEWVDGEGWMPTNVSTG